MPDEYPYDRPAFHKLAPTAPMLTEADILESLHVCFDPELPVNIVDLGLIDRVILTPDPDAPGIQPRLHAHIDLLRRTADETREAMLHAQVANRLAGMYAISRTTVTFLNEPAWTADRMTDAARTHLGLTRPTKPGLVQIQLS